MSQNNSNSDEAQPQSDSQALIEDLRGQVEKFKNDYLYLRAEFDTYRRNAIKERSEQNKYGAERLVSDLLSVMDNFERALETRLSAENFANYAKGVEMTANEFRHTLQRHGVSEIPALGQPFDPAFHEALTSETTTATPAGNVLRVLRKPYKLHDKVIRPGQVVVARAPEEN